MIDRGSRTVRGAALLTIVLLGAPSVAGAQPENPGETSPGSTAAAEPRPSASQPAAPLFKAFAPVARPAVAAAACRAALTREPTVREVVAAALDEANVSAARVAASLRRSRRRGWLPQLHLIGLFQQRSTAASYSMDDGLYASALPFRERSVTQQERLGVYAGAMASFDLRALISEAHEQRALDAVTYRHRLVQKVCALYFARRRLQSRLCSEQLAPAAEVRVVLEVRELTAVLDGLSGGALSRPAAVR